MHSIFYTVELQILIDADHPARALAVSFTNLGQGDGRWWDSGVGGAQAMAHAVTLTSAQRTEMIYH